MSREEQRGRGALLQDICKGTKLKKVTQINDRSAPILESEYSSLAWPPHWVLLWALSCVLASGSWLEELIIPSIITSLPLSFQSPRAAVAAATAPAQLRSSPKEAFSKGVCPSSDPWEQRTAQVKALRLWLMKGSVGDPRAGKG